MTGEREDCTDLQKTSSVEVVKDDMREAHLEEDTPDFICRFLRAIEAEPAPESMLLLFDRLDGDANEMQRRHICRAKWGIPSATAALLLSIVQLSFHSKMGDRLSGALLVLEFVLVLVTACCVVPELSGRGHHQWLLARYRAEQLRLSKWRLFIEPGLATRSAASLSADLESAIVRNDLHEAAELQERARHEEAAAIPRAEPAGSGLRALLDHYVDNRLAAQIGYFHRKSQEEGGFFTNPALMPAFFLATLVFVALHLIPELYITFTTGSASKDDGPGFVFAFIAALIPAGLAGARTWRSTLEATRNSTRACAKENALAAYRRRLQNPAIGPFEAFGILACCEGLFAQEQGEWLRLMLEAESYM